MIFRVNRPFKVCLYKTQIWCRTTFFVGRQKLELFLILPSGMTQLNKPDGISVLCGAARHWCCVVPHGIGVVWCRTALVLCGAARHWCCVGQHHVVPDPTNNVGLCKYPLSVNGCRSDALGFAFASEAKGLGLNLSVEITGNRR
jgi:hypothetical protein